MLSFSSLTLASMGTTTSGKAGWKASTCALCRRIRKREESVHCRLTQRRLVHLLRRRPANTLGNEENFSLFPHPLSLSLSFSTSLSTSLFYLPNEPSYLRQLSMSTSLAALVTFGFFRSSTFMSLSNWKEWSPNTNSLTHSHYTHGHIMERGW